MNEDDDGTEEHEAPLEEVDIQYVIMERKVERQVIAEQKRQVDLQRIKDMRSATGVDPLQLFPKEIWVKLLDAMNPVDRGSMWQIHPLFRNLMKNARIKDILFPQLLRVDKFKEFLSSADDFRYEQLRCISKSIQNSFDDWMEVKLKRRIQEAEAISSSYLHGIVNICHGRIKERRLLERLLASFQDEDNPAKRFFPRELSVSFQNVFEGRIHDRQYVQQVCTEFKNNITSLLEIIGDQIWNARIIFDSGLAIDSASECYTLFHHWVTLMPNLKWLEMSIRVQEYQLVENSVVRKLPLPRMTSLERLSFYSGFQIREDFRTSHILELIIKANPHIKMLDLAEEKNAGLRLLPGQLIKSLMLTSFSTYDRYFYRSMTLLEIQNIMNFNWHLKTITIALDHSEVYGSMNFLIQFLNKFPTLEKVRLKRLRGLHVMGDGDHENPRKLHYLQLPNLTDLEVKVISPQLEIDLYFFFSLQFLLFCKKLKTLKWTLRDVDDPDLFSVREYLVQMEKEKHGKTIDFRAGLRPLHQSNIWDVFTGLDNVDVDIRDSGKSESCTHQYQRTAIDRRMTLAEFLGSHECSRNHLKHCVIFQE